MHFNARTTPSNHQDVCEFNCDESGFTLIELMITTAITIIIISLLMEIYLACQQSIKLENALNTIQDNVNTVNALFSSEIHQAGHIGCARLTPDFPIISNQYPPFNANNKLTGNSANELTIRYAEYPNTYLIEPMRYNNMIHTDTNMHVEPGNILLVSNCERAEVVSVKTVSHKTHTQEITLTAPMHDKYEKYAEVSRLASNRFYIAKSSYPHQDGSDIDSLFVEDIHHQKSEVVMGLSRMQISYTIQKGGQVSEVTADEVENWENVLGVSMDFEYHTPPIKKKSHFYAALNSGNN